MMVGFSNYFQSFHFISNTLNKQMHIGYILLNFRCTDRTIFEQFQTFQQLRKQFIFADDIYCKCFWLATLTESVLLEIWRISRSCGISRPKQWQEDIHFGSAGIFCDQVLEPLHVFFFLLSLNLIETCFIILIVIFY